MQGYTEIYKGIYKIIQGYTEIYKDLHYIVMRDMVTMS